jgi:hypothetical protein
MGPLVLFAGLALGYVLHVVGEKHAHALGALPPSANGLELGKWYRVLVRSSLDARTFGPDAAGMQIQAALGRQGFDVRAANPNAGGDPFVYDAYGVYRGGSGSLVDDAPGGVQLLGASPTTPVATTVGGSLQYIDARPVPLNQGATYAGRANIPWPISMLVTRDAIADKLTSKGFSNVHVYMKPEELPATWPASEKGGDVFASASYAPGDSPEATMELPSQVISVWLAPELANEIPKEVPP